MQLALLAMKYFPAWAMPIGVILIEVGWCFHRKHRGPYRVCFGLGTLMAAASLFWLANAAKMDPDNWGAHNIASTSESVEP